MLHAGSGVKKNIVCRKIQLRLIYTILYYFGLRLNEVRFITKNDFINLLDFGELSICHYKTKTVKIHIMEKKGREQILKLLPEIDIFFDDNNFQFLGNSLNFSRNKKKQDLNQERKNTLNEDSLLKIVNWDMAKTFKEYKLNKNFKSHSFRAVYITRLLRTISVQNVAAIVGHESISSTIQYNRYNLKKAEKVAFLEKSFDLE
jgi:integrase